MVRLVTLFLRSHPHYTSLPRPQLLLFDFTCSLLHRPVPTKLCRLVN